MNLTRLNNLEFIEVVKMIQRARRHLSNQIPAAVLSCFGTAAGPLAETSNTGSSKAWRKKRRRQRAAKL